MKTFYQLLLWTIFAIPAYADPTWWTSQSVTNGSAAANYSPVLQGQLKHIANAAYSHLNSQLMPTATSQEIANAWAQAFGGTSPLPFANTGNNYVVMNQGQAKHIASGIYQFLQQQSSYSEKDLVDMLSLNMPAGVRWNSPRPWSAATGDDANRSPILLGQLKFIFSLDATYTSGSYTPAAPPNDTDGDAIPNASDSDSTASNGLADFAGGSSDYDAINNTVESLSGMSSSSFNPASGQWGESSKVASGLRGATVSSGVLLILPGHGRGVFVANEPDLQLQGIAIEHN